MTPDDKKRAAAVAALDHLDDARIIGVGTGSTVNHFIDALAGIRSRIEGAVSSSEASSDRLKKAGAKRKKAGGRRKKTAAAATTAAKRKKTASRRKKTASR